MTSRDVEQAVLMLMLEYVVTNRERIRKLSEKTRILLVRWKLIVMMEDIFKTHVRDFHKRTRSWDIKSLTTFRAKD